jgi:hypothetical protein
MESPVPGKFAYIESLDSIRTQMPTAAHWIIGVRRPGVEEQADPLFTAILEHAEVAGARCGDVTAGIVRDKQAQFHQVGFSAKHGAGRCRLNLAANLKSGAKRAERLVAIGY